jgi:Polyketide synthase modules and related proteins
MDIVRSEGCGVIVLKPLHQAIEDHHKIFLSDIAYTLQTGRVAMPERLAVYVTSMDDLIDKLQLLC